MRPNTEWLDGSGLEIDDGVVCDSTCLAAPGVVAAGDVARWPNKRFGWKMARLEHWDHAVQMGQAAARRLLADDDTAEHFAPVPWFWSDQYDLKIQIAGLPIGAQMIEVRGSVDDGKFAVVHLAADGGLCAVEAVNLPAEYMGGRATIARQRASGA